MTVAEYVSRHTKSLAMFKQIIIIHDGEFAQYHQGYFTLSAITTDYGNREMWNATVKNAKLFLSLERTEKQRGGMTVKSYLFQHKNILADMNGVVLWFKWTSKKIVFPINRLDDIFAQQYRDREIDDISVSRDLYIQLQIKGKQNPIFKPIMGRSTKDKKTGLRTYIKKSEQWFNEGQK